MKSLSHVGHLETPWTAAYQAPPSMGFRGLQMEEIGFKRQTFFIPLICGRRKQTISVRFLASLIAQLVKNLPAKRETWVWSLGWEDPLEKGKATHSSVLAWRIPWTGVTKSQTQLSNFKCKCNMSPGRAQGLPTMILRSHLALGLGRWMHSPFFAADQVPFLAGCQESSHLAGMGSLDFLNAQPVVKNFQMWLKWSCHGNQVWRPISPVLRRKSASQTWQATSVTWFGIDLGKAAR